MDPARPRDAVSDTPSLADDLRRKIEWHEVQLVVLRAALAQEEERDA
jgi:hypothetical protein